MVRACPWRLAAAFGLSTLAGILFRFSSTEIKMGITGKSLSPVVDRPVQTPVDAQRQEFPRDAPVVEESERGTVGDGLKDSDAHSSAAEAETGEGGGTGDAEGEVSAAADEPKAEVAENHVEPAVASIPSKSRREAFVFQAFNEVTPHSAFATSLYVAAYSIRKTGSKRRILVQITADSKLDPSMVAALGLELVVVDYIPMNEDLCTDGRVPKAKARLLKAGFTMLRVFQQDDYDVLLYMDSDLLVTSSVDHLFQLVGDDRSKEYPCALTPVGTMRCRQWTTSSPKANVGFFLVKPSAEIFKSAMERITHPYKCGVGSQEMLKSWFRSSFGPMSVPVFYNKQADLDADLASLNERHRLEASPPAKGPAWRMAITKGVAVDPKNVQSAKQRLSQGQKASVSFIPTHGRKKCACMSLKYNCKMDSKVGDISSFCGRDVGAEASIPGPVSRTIVVKHWSGESKPWKDWWDSKHESPKSRLNGAQRASVLLWWKYKKEMENFVKDYHTKAR